MSACGCKVAPEFGSTTCSLVSPIMRFNDARTGSYMINAIRQSFSYARIIGEKYEEQDEEQF
jgi:hypothetical protein